jgi:hypothetical protein
VEEAALLSEAEVILSEVVILSEEVIPPVAATSQEAVLQDTRLVIRWVMPLAASLDTAHRRRVHSIELRNRTRGPTDLHSYSILA